MKTCLKRFALLLAVCMLLTPLFVTGASADTPLDPTREDCSLRVTIPWFKEEDPGTAEFVFAVYRVASMGENGVLYPEGAFGGMDLNPVDGQYDADALAKTALGISEGLEPDAWYTVGDTIKNLETGLYLVLVRGNGQDRPEYLYDEDGAPYATVAETVGYQYIFSPVLVTLPSLEGESWVYWQTINFKAEQHKKAEKKLMLHKVDPEEGNKPLEGATFKLYSTRVPDDIIPEDTILTYVEGGNPFDETAGGYVTLYCIGSYTTDKNGDIVIDVPFLDDNTLYAWVESKAPAGYELDPTPQFFFAYGEVIPNAYEDWMNVLSPVTNLDTHLRFNGKDPQDAGSVVLHRRAQVTIVEDEDDEAAEGEETEKVVRKTVKNIVSLQNASDPEKGGQPVWVRVKAVKNEEFSGREWKSFGEFYPNCSDDYGLWAGGEGGWWYYNEPLQPGDMTVDLNVEVLASESELENFAGRVAILYDVYPVVEDGNGGYEPVDFFWDPFRREGGENAMFPPALLPMASGATGGYVVELSGGWGVKACSDTVRVQRSYYCDNKEEWEVIRAENKKSNENPPDEPGEELPSTGGSGTGAFYIAGGGLIAIALFLYMVRKRERDEA